MLVTGEVDRVTGFEKGFPIHHAWRGGSWQPDPLIPDDQAHCTGWKATHAIARHLPGAFIQSSVGTTFHLTTTATA